MPRGLPDASVAHRRTLAVGVTAFVVGAAAAFVAAVAAAVRFGVFGQGWGAVFRGVLSGAVVALFAGAGSAAAAGGLMDRWYHWRGAFACPYCGRLLRRRAKPPCACWPDPAHPLAEVWARLSRSHRPPPLRHYRRRLAPVVALYLALVPVVLAAVVVVRQLRPRATPFVYEFVLVHVCLCVLAAAAIALVVATLELLGHGRRWRLRADAFLRTLMIWPTAAWLGWGIAKLIGLF